MIAQPTIGDFVAIIYRRKWSMMFVTTVVVIMGAAYLATAVPHYKSDAAIVVRFGNAAGPVTDLARDQSPYVIDSSERRELISAYIQILASPDLAEATIAKVGLAKLYPELINNRKLPGTPMDTAIKRFSTDLSTSAEATGNVIRLSFSSSNPAVSKETLEVVIDEYIRRESEIFSDTNLAFQKQQADLTYKRLLAAQDSLAAYKTSTGVSDFNSQMNALIKQQSELMGRLHVAEVSLTEATQKRDALNRLIHTVSVATTDSSGDKYRQVDDAQGRVNELQAREREMTAMHGVDWPAAKAMRANIAEAQSTVAASAATMGGRRLTRQSEVYQSVQTDLLRITAEAQSDQQAVTLVSGQVSDVAKQVSNLEAQRSGLQERQRELDIADSTYRSIALHVEDSRIGADRLRDGISRVAVIVQPDMPLVPSDPRYRLLALVTAASAILSGLIFVFLREFLDDRLVSPRQISERLNVPVLATFDRR